MLDRSRKSLLDGTARQRLEGSTRQLLERSRSTVAQFVGTESAGETSSQEVLAGVCSSVALRDLNIVDSLLEQLEQMEVDEQDPDALAKLYKLDHLATRLRRNSENLRVLAGREAGGGRDTTAPLVDVIRAGMSAIEHYPRVDLGKVAALDVVGFAADDVSRLLAELLDNATKHSPPSSEVAVGAHLTEQGSVLVRVEDSGIGLPAARLSALNEQLSHSPKLERSTVQHMGLAVVRRLAIGHDIRVWLARRAPHGTTASVLLPAPLLRSSTSSGSGGGRPVASSTTGAPTGAPATGAPTAGTATATPSTVDTRAAGPSPAAASTAETASSSGLPRRVPRTDRSEPPKSGDAPDDDAPTTANGLPRRVPRSLKESGPGGCPDDGAEPAWPQRESAEQSPEQRRKGHEQLLADLGEFAEGEQAAHADHRAGSEPGTHGESGTGGDTGTNRAAEADSESEPPPEGRDK